MMSFAGGRGGYMGGPGAGGYAGGTGYGGGSFGGSYGGSMGGGMYGDRRGDACCDEGGAGGRSDGCSACGVGCGGSGAGNGALAYVGQGQGEYIQETTYKYVGQGGDFNPGRKRDYTCALGSCCLLLCLIPCLLWLLSSLMDTTTLPFDCDEGFSNWQTMWPQAKMEYCCSATGRGCPIETTVFPTSNPTAPPTPFVTTPPTPPPTPPPTAPPTQARPTGPVDPFNCAIGVESSWGAEK